MPWEFQFWQICPLPAGWLGVDVVLLKAVLAGWLVQLGQVVLTLTPGSNINLLAIIFLSKIVIFFGRSVELGQPYWSPWNRQDVQQVVLHQHLNIIILINPLDPNSWNWLDCSKSHRLNYRTKMNWWSKVQTWFEYFNMLLNMLLLKYHPHLHFLSFLGTFSLLVSNLRRHTPREQ